MCVSAMHILCFLFIFHGRAGYVAAIRGNRNPESGKKIRAFCPYFALLYLFLFARKAAFGKYCLVFKAYNFYFGFNICFSHFFSPKNQYSLADNP